jgi:hypothetical protein
MKCPACPRGVLIPGQCEVSMTRETATVVVQSIPASICTVCRAEFIGETALTRALELAEVSATGEGAPIRTPGAAVMAVTRWRA